MTLLSKSRRDRKFKKTALNIYMDSSECVPRITSCLLTFTVYSWLGVNQGHFKSCAPATNLHPDHYRSLFKIGRCRGWGCLPFPVAPPHLRSSSAYFILFFSTRPVSVFQPSKLRSSIRELLPWRRRYIQSKRVGDRGSECCHPSAAPTAAPPTPLSAHFLPLAVKLHDVFQLHARRGRRLDRRLPTGRPPLSITRKILTFQKSKKNTSCRHLLIPHVSRTTRLHRSSDQHNYLMTYSEKRVVFGVFNMFCWHFSDNEGQNK